MKKFQRTILRKAMLGMKKQKGMTLLEIIIALGIIGVVSAGVVVLAQRAIDAQNMTKATQAANTAQIAMTQTYRNLGKYPASTDRAGAIEVANGLLGLGRVAEDDVKNAFTGEIIPIYAFDRLNADDNKAFALAYEGLSLDQCRQLVTNTVEMFPYIEVQAGATSAKPATAYQTATADAATGGAVVLQAPNGGAGNLDLTEMTHVSNLCGTDEGATYSVLLGNS